MNASFFFYDLETSGINPRESRIMQFAGQRTDIDLNPVGESFNIIIRLPEDTVPDPEAILITGITPQQTLSDGVSEAEFLRIFHEQIATPGTIFVGYNTVRFDDEFMRYVQYRNFYDPYEWQYTEGKSRWDLLDVVRMTRALRPEGIEWPVDDKGVATNRLELLTKANGISHDAAHDALSDVLASISLAKLLKERQPKLFEYLLKMRDKKAISQLVEQGKPFLYSSGKYDTAYQKTTAVAVITKHPQRQAAVVFDLRYDPTPFLDLSPAEIAAAWKRRKHEEGIRLPAKTLQYNRCPAVAPLAVLDEASQERLELKIDLIHKHAEILTNSNFERNILEALAIMDKQQASFSNDFVDGQLYDGFFGATDKSACRVVRSADPNELSPELVHFSDKRLNKLLPLYKARNFPNELTAEERAVWESHRHDWLLSGGKNSRLATFFDTLSVLAANSELSSDKQYLLEELQLYGQSIIPMTEEY